MEDKDNEEKQGGQTEQEVITPWYLLTLIKPLIAEELIATFRFDREGLIIKFPNSQKFRMYIKPI